jgi:hypothetical protein
MLGLKSFRTAAVVISGIELAEAIKKGQFKIGKLCGPTATMPEIWRGPWLRKQTTPDRRGRHDRLPSQSEICTRTISSSFSISTVSGRPS